MCISCCLLRTQVIFATFLCKRRTIKKINSNLLDAVQCFMLMLFINIKTWVLLDSDNFCVNDKMKYFSHLANLDEPPPHIHPTTTTNTHTYICMCLWVCVNVPSILCNCLAFDKCVTAKSMTTTAWWIFTQYARNQQCLSNQEKKKDGRTKQR